LADKGFRHKVPESQLGKTLLKLQKRYMDIKVAEMNKPNQGKKRMMGNQSISVTNIQKGGAR